MESQSTKMLPDVSEGLEPHVSASALLDNKNYATTPTWFVMDYKFSACSTEMKKEKQFRSI